MTRPGERVTDGAVHEDGRRETHHGQGDRGRGGELDAGADGGKPGPRTGESTPWGADAIHRVIEEACGRHVGPSDSQRSSTRSISWSVVMPVVLRWRSRARPHPVPRHRPVGMVKAGAGRSDRDIERPRRSPPSLGPRRGAAPTGLAGPVTSGGSRARAGPGQRRSGSRRRSSGHRWAGREGSRSATLALRLDEAGPNHQPMEPGIETVRIAEPGQSRQAMTNASCRRILRTIDIAQDPMGEREQSTEARPDQVGECLAVAVSCRFDEIVVHERSRSSMAPVGARSAHYGGRTAAGIHSSCDASSVGSRHTGRPSSA